MNIYVGNLSYQTTEDDLRQAFATYGEITSLNIVKDKFSGDSRGFGFVEMADDTAGQNAINELNGTDLNGRNLRVSEAKPRQDSRGGGGGGRRGGGGGGGGRGGGYGGGGGRGGGQGGGRGGNRGGNDRY